MRVEYNSRLNHLLHYRDLERITAPVIQPLLEEGHTID